MAWFERAKKENREENQDDLEIKPTKEMEEKLGKIDTLESSVNEIKSKTAVLDRMTTYLDEQDAAKRAAKAKELADKTKVNSEEMDEKWLTDPKAAFNDSVQPLVLATINANSRATRREIFDDPKFEYYTGDFKKEVDALIDNSLAPSARNDQQSIENCYFLVLGKKTREIAEGKIKSRFAAVSTASAGTGTSKTDQTDTTPLTDEEKRAASRFGMTEAEYGKIKKELNYV